ncbi:MAG TPA: hypothetical protein VIN40_01635 [Candidatus Tyrphobacter sp.]
MAESRVHATTVIDRREPAGGVIVLGVRASALAAAAGPGQYVMAIPPGGETAAVALGVYEAEEERVSLLFFVTGKRTRELALLRPGDTLALLGPLGNGFELQGSDRDVAIVAGGVGIASVLLPALALRRNGAHVRLFYGARTASLLVERERFERAGCETIVTTDDGSEGSRGFVTDALAEAQMPGLFLACGPMPMLRATADIALRCGVPAQLCLEETFACGVGGCWGCVVPISNASAQAPAFPPSPNGVVYARICREGPVFRAGELRW